MRRFATAVMQETRTQVPAVTRLRHRKQPSYTHIQSKKTSNDQELIQSDPISCPQSQKGNNLIHKLTIVYERHSRQTE